MRNEWTIPADAQPPVRADDAVRPGEMFTPHWHRCFGCRPVDEGGLGMTFQAGTGVEALGRVPVDPLYEGGPGVIHGGVLSTIFDEGMGTAAILLGGQLVTAHLQIDYARPVLLGTELAVPARVDAVAGRKVYASAEVYDAADYDPAAGTGGEALATSRALFIVIDPRQHFKDSIARSPAR